MSRGLNENNQLKGKLEAQLNRLLDQLEDIQKDRESLDEEEYIELKTDTMEQVKEPSKFKTAILFPCFSWENSKLASTRSVKVTSVSLTPWERCS